MRFCEVTDTLLKSAELSRVVPQGEPRVPACESKNESFGNTPLNAELQMIHWDHDGTQIIIEQPGELESKVLPLVYKQSRFASFSRQLNVRPAHATPHHALIPGSDLRLDAEGVPSQHWQGWKQRA